MVPAYRNDNAAHSPFWVIHSTIFQVATVINDRRFVYPFLLATPAALARSINQVRNELAAAVIHSLCCPRIRHSGRRSYVAMFGSAGPHLTSINYSPFWKSAVRKR